MIYLLEILTRNMAENAGRESYLVTSRNDCDPTRDRTRLREVSAFFFHFDSTNRTATIPAIIRFPLVYEENENGSCGRGSSSMGSSSNMVEELTKFKKFGSSRWKCPMLRTQNRSIIFVIWR